MRPLLVPLLALLACDVPPDALSTTETADPLTCFGCTDLYVVAHQDDDLLFMSPDLDRSIQSGNTVWTIYLTAGDAGRDQTYWTNRENGIAAAYAQMAGVANSWSWGWFWFSGNWIRTGYLVGRPNVRVVFLRLPDGNPDGTGYTVTGNTSLRLLWNNDILSITSLDGFTSYSRAELIDTLDWLISQVSPNRISILDPTEAHGADHSDHVHAARFLDVARRRYPNGHLFSMHRTYNITGLPANLSSAQQTRKHSAFVTYALNDSAICSGAPCTITGEYYEWLSRQYPKSTVQGIEGRVTGKNGICLEIQNGATADGTRLQVATCNNSARQRFSVEMDQTIRQSGKCLTVNGALDDGVAVVLSTCNNSLTQRFTLLSDGRILGANGKCLDIEAGNTSPGTEVQIWGCVNVPQQRWVVEADAATVRSSGSNFSDSDLGSDPTKARAFGLADLDDDGDPDACVRRADGVWCAKNNGSGSFAAYTRWTTEYSDTLGWANPIYGPTLRYGDINGDGLADVCGRGGAGVICAHSNGAAFLAPSLRSGSFSDANGFSHPSRATTVNLGDIDNDGDLDLCGRASYGIICARNTGGGLFAAASTWLNNEFTDALGWSDPKYGSTIMMGDINADGRADICGRGTEKVICARSTGSAFTDPARWSHLTDYADSEGWGANVAYYGSLRLADVDGDGGADLCGRGSAGIWCSISQGGASFDEKRLIFFNNFTDTQGWNQERFGPTVQWADIDGDSRMDPCMRGVNGAVCTAAP